MWRRYSLSVIPFLATLAIPWDLPANAGWGTVLLSRTLLLLFDAALLGPLLPILWPSEVSDAFGRTLPAVPTSRASSGLRLHCCRCSRSLASPRRTSAGSAR